MDTMATEPERLPRARARRPPLPQSRPNADIEMAVGRGVHFIETEDRETPSDSGSSSPRIGPNSSEPERLPRARARRPPLPQSRPNADIEMAVGRGIHFIETEDRETPSDSGRSSPRIGPNSPDYYIAGEPTAKEYEPSDFGRSNSMEAAIYRAAIAGDIDGLTTALQQNSQLNLLNQLTPRDDTILHIAARLGHHHLAEHIQSCYPDLFKSKNYNDDHPLHLAAAAGHLSIVQSLITNASQFARSRGPETEVVLLQEYFNVINGQNKQGNTPLHMAVKAHQYEVALFLVKRAGSVLISCFPYLEKESPLYLAAEAGHQELFELMMRFVAWNVDAQNMLKDGQPLLHVAITTRNKVILETALKYVSSLIDAPDRRGRKPLSYAASIGYVDGVCYILDTFVDCIYKRDGDGSYPIHEASSQGHIDVVKEFLQRFPDSGELLNKEGQNILHVAAKSGKANIVSYILKAPELEMLVNDTDEDGNTPLLLASKNAQAKIVSILTWDKRVGLEIENGKGLTALDVSLNVMGTTSLIHQFPVINLRDPTLPAENIETEKNSNVEVYKDRVNTLLLVATIIMTVTFAAGITVPGGYDDSETHKGMALMVKKSAFQVFVIANAVAMYSSIIVAVLLIWAQLGDLSLIRVSLNLASPLFGGALMMVAISFMTGVYLVVSNLNWLSYVILIMGLIFVLALSTLLILLFLPASLNHRMLRYIFYYPFSLWLLILKKWS
ncbi:Protein ACCELERATED CELL DEATH 6 [Camellia lanceoleosa]|uniref:Protein ACCELERATED CELL DEATH 6 n=1 Tax=Camellia lanceoleosa TaxID=1840588 RepID=A0ACC0HG44_9ERIC|nr:Protein ACCELERATED CELL DEATH 6 [Camellia lanceoleosa]